MRAIDYIDQRGAIREHLTTRAGVAAGSPTRTLCGLKLERRQLQVAAGNPRCTRCEEIARRGRPREVYGERYGEAFTAERGLVFVNGEPALSARGDQLVARPFVELTCQRCGGVKVYMPTVLASRFEQALGRRMFWFTGDPWLECPNYCAACAPFGPLPSHQQALAETWPD